MIYNFHDAKSGHYSSIDLYSPGFFYLVPHTTVIVHIQLVLGSIHKDMFYNYNESINDDNNMMSKMF